MAKNIITGGIGASPGGLIYYLTGGLAAGAAFIPSVHPYWTFSVAAAGRVIDAPAGERVIIVPAGGRVIDGGVYDG